MIVLRRCRRGRDDEDAVVEGGARNLGLQGRGRRASRAPKPAGEGTWWQARTPHTGGEREERGGEADGRSPRANGGPVLSPLGVRHPSWRAPRHVVFRVSVLSASSERGRDRYQPPPFASPLSSNFVIALRARSDEQEERESPLFIVPFERTYLVLRYQIIAFIDRRHVAPFLFLL